MVESYSMRLPEFEGPLDLLLQMIEHRELDITRVSLAAVADQYLEFITRPGAIELSTLADYLIIAAKLVLAKSRLLLPQANHIDEQEGEDSAEALARQLLQYQVFKQAALVLKRREQQGLQSFPRRTPATRPPVAQPTRIAGLTFDKLYSALRRTVEANPQLPTGTLNEPLRVSIQHRIERIRELTITEPRIAFSALLQEAHTRVEIIVTFLAVLESLKRKLIIVNQGELFGEIYLIRRNDAALRTPVLDDDETDFTGA